MRKTFRKIVSGVMAVLLMQLSLPATSFGEESAPQVVQAVGAGTDGAEQEGSVVEAASLAGDDVVTVTARAHSVDPDGWSATVTGVHDYCRWRPEGFRQLPVPARLYLQVRSLYLDIRPHFPSCRDFP